MRVVRALVDLETGGAQDGSALERERVQRSDVAGRPEPEHARNPMWRKGSEPVQHDGEGRCVTSDGCDQLDSGEGPSILDLAEEVHGEMERLRPCPANVRNLLAESLLQSLRHLEPRLRDGHGEEAPHPAGLAVGVALGLGLAGAGVGLGAVHGLPPALVSVTSIWFTAQS